MGLLTVERPFPDRHRPPHGLSRTPPGGFEAVKLRYGTGHELSNPCRNRCLLIDREVPDPPQGLFVEAQGDIACHCHRTPYSAHI